MIWRFLYALLSVPALILWAPVLLRRGWRQGKYRSDLRQRLGFLSPTTREELKQGDWIWIHAVSVGELEAATPLLEALRRSDPGSRLLLSTTTDTGLAQAHRRDVDRVIRFPLDLPFVARRVLRQIRPRGVILLETEIWPGFLGACRRLGIPVILANGRISDRSYPRYRWLRPALEAILEGVVLFLMQTDEDARRIRSIGAPAERVRVTGNLKFDRVIQAAGQIDPLDVREGLGLPASTPLVVAGSTHPPEGIWMLEMMPRFLERFPELVLLIAPRHLQDLPVLQKRAAALGLEAVLRSELPSAARTEGRRPFHHAVILMDRMGELAASYAPARCAFVGRSLPPNRGGQNVLEPAAWGVPVLFGPNTGNFRSAVSLLLRSGCAVRVADRNELEAEIMLLLNEPERAAEMGLRARRVMDRNRGATDRVVQALSRALLDPRRTP